MDIKVIEFYSIYKYKILNMKTLTDYINKHSKRPLYETYLEDLKDFFGEDLNPDDIIMDHDIILETINTHNTEDLKKQILKLYGDKYKIDFSSPTPTKESNDKKAFDINFNDTFDLKSEKFIDLLNRYGYYVTRSGDGWGSICPTYATDVYDQVYVKNHGILYHFTTKDKEQSIIENGLRIKDNKYREFPKRIYLYSALTIFDKDRKLLDEVKSFIQQVVTVFLQKVVIFKIDMNKISKNVNFYTDDYMDEEESVYTYTNIPPEAITKIDFKR